MTAIPPDELARLRASAAPHALLDVRERGAYETDVVLKPYDKGRAAMEAYLRWEEALTETGESAHELHR